MLWITLIAIGVAIFILKGKGYMAARAKNSIVSWATGQEGNCCDCKHCRRDDSGRYSETGYFCALSKCNHITEATKMNCFEPIKVDMEFLTELFSLEIWNDAGKQYIRQSLMGKQITWAALDTFLSQLAAEHPEFIR